MAVLTIGTTSISPSEMSLDVMDISNAERNAKGTMIIERIATKRKIELRFSYLSAAELKTILTAVSGVTFPVTYTDPITNSNRTATFYCGDRSVGVVSFINGTPVYKDVSFNLIEV